MQLPILPLMLLSSSKKLKEFWLFWHQDMNLESYQIDGKLNEKLNQPDPMTRSIDACYIFWLGYVDKSGTKKSIWIKMCIWPLRCLFKEIAIRDSPTSKSNIRNRLCASNLPHWKVCLFNGVGSSTSKLSCLSGNNCKYLGAAVAE